MHEQNETAVANAGRMIAVWLVLAALGMLFAAGMLGYILIRTRHTETFHQGSLQLPIGFWISTALLLAGGVALELARRFSLRDMQKLLHQSLATALVLILGFLIVQIPSLSALLHQHEKLRQEGVGLYGLAFMLIALHGLHVVGGLVPLILVVIGAKRGRYGQGNTEAVRGTVWYWHFLDLVWILMFSVFLILG